MNRFFSKQNKKVVAYVYSCLKQHFNLTTTQPQNKMFLDVTHQTNILSQAKCETKCSTSTSTSALSSTITSTISTNHFNSCNVGVKKYKIVATSQQLQSFLNEEAFISSQQKLKELFQQNYVDFTHGYHHAKLVMNHTIKAIKRILKKDQASSNSHNGDQNIILSNQEFIDFSNEKSQNPAIDSSAQIAYIDIDIEYIKLIIFAALLHDADDRKYFPLNKNCENAEKIILYYYQRSQNPENSRKSFQQNSKERSIPKIKNKKNHNIQKIQQNIQFVKDIINKVSYSKNGDKITYNHPQIFLYPRYADRIQAIGSKGIIRSFQYNIHRGQKLFTQETKIPKNYEQLIQISKGRDLLYMTKNGKSQSFIDHIFDKLIHLKIPDSIKNQYLRECYEKGREQIADFVLRCAQTQYQTIFQEIKRLQKQIQMEMKNQI